MSGCGDRSRAHPKVVQTLLGHSDPAETLRTYAHLGGGRFRPCSDCMSELLGEGPADFSRNSEPSSN